MMAEPRGIAFVLWWVAVTWTYIYALPCDPPSPCDCSKGNHNELFVNCSTRDLIHVPPIPRKVTHLDLTHNLINVISNDSLTFLWNLTYLDLSFCNITVFDHAAFRETPRLKIFNISRNRELHFEGLRNISLALSKTDIEVLNINGINDILGLCTELKADHLKGLENTSLKELYIDSNAIEQVEPEVFDHLPQNLQHISIADNRFQYGKYVLRLRSLRNLKTLNISYGNSPHMPIFPFLYRNITRRSRRSQVEFIPRIPLPPKLEYVYVNNCGLKYSLRAMLLSPSKLLHMDLSDNVLFEWVGPMNGTQRIRYLDLSRNFCDNVSKNFLSSFPNLETLLLQGNILGNVIGDDSNGDIFKNLTILTHLNLSQNQIRVLQYPVFQDLGSLQMLDLSNNILNMLDIQIDIMTNLTWVDLSYNQLSYLPSTLTRSLDAINHGNLTVNLIGNPLKCDCDTYIFVQWLQDTNVKISNRNRTTCKTTGGVSNLTEIGDVSMQLHKHCANYVGLILGVLGVLLVIVIVIIAPIVYRYRWKLRYLYFMTKNKYKGYSALSTREQGQYTYDAFISYADEELQFVKSQMIVKLENESNLSLCVHNRDFLPGREIAANITHAIHNSNKTLVILTRNFLRSYWCMYELNMARMESMYSGREALCLVLLEPIPASELPLNILYLTQGDSYIEFPNDPDGDAFFWNTIIRTLREI